MRGEARALAGRLAFEFTPAAIFGSAVVFATATWAALPPLSITPAAAGAAAFGGIWLALNRFGAPQGRFSVPEFDSPGFARRAFGGVGAPRTGGRGCAGRAAGRFCPGSRRGGRRADPRGRPRASTRIHASSGCSSPTERQERCRRGSTATALAPRQLAGCHAGASRRSCSTPPFASIGPVTPRSSGPRGRS